MPPPNSPAPASSVQQQAQLAYLATLQKTTVAMQGFVSTVKQATNPFGPGGLAKLPGIAPVIRPSVPLIPPLPVARPAATKTPVGLVIAPVRLVRFESTAMGQLASLLRQTGAGAAVRNPMKEKPGGLQNPFRPLTVAAAAATASIAGLARSGLSGTTEGYRLELQFQTLSRQVASIFLPVIDAVTMRMQKLNFTLMNLTGSQQRNLMRGGLAVAGIGAFGGGLAALSPLLGPVIGLFSGIVTPLMSLAGIGGPVTAVLGVVAVGVAGLTAGLAYLATVNKPLRDSLRQVWDAMKQAWQATAPLREALLEIVTDAAAAFFRELAREIMIVATNKEIVNFLRELADAIREAAASIPPFVADMQRLKNEMIKQVAGVDMAKEHAKGIKLDDDLALMHKQMNIGNKEKQGIFWNPFRDKDFAAAKGIKPDKDNGRQDVHPFQPGREDAANQAARFQDAFLKIDNDVPQQQLNQIILVRMGVEAVAAGLEKLGVKLDFGNRPAPNGRPRGAN